MTEVIEPHLVKREFTDYAGVGELVGAEPRTEIKYEILRPTHDREVAFLFRVKKMEGFIEKIAKLEANPNALADDFDNYVLLQHLIDEARNEFGLEP